MRSLPMWLAALSCAACASAPPLAERELASPPPCLVDVEAARGFPLRAIGCPAMIDGVGVSPDAFNAWARVNIILQPIDEEGWAQMKVEYLEIFVQQELVDRELAASGFTLDAGERARWSAVMYGEGEAFEERLAIATAEGERTEGEVRATWRRHVTRRAYACHVAGCARRPGWDPARDQGLSYAAYEDLAQAVMGRHEVVLMPENVEVFGG